MSRSFSSSLDKILQIRASSPASFEGFKEKLIALEAVAYLDEPSTVIERLREIIPAFRLSSDSETSIMPTGADAVDKEVAGFGGSQGSQTHPGSPIVDPGAPWEVAF